MDPLSSLLDKLLGKQEPVCFHSIHDPCDYAAHELRIASDVVEQLNRGPFLLLMPPGGKQ